MTISTFPSESTTEKRKLAEKPTIEDQRKLYSEYLQHMKAAITGYKLASLDLQHAKPGTAEYVVFSNRANRFWYQYVGDEYDEVVGDGEDDNTSEKKKMESKKAQKRKRKAEQEEDAKLSDHDLNAKYRRLKARQTEARIDRERRKLWPKFSHHCDWRCPVPECFELLPMGQGQAVVPSRRSRCRLASRQVQMAGVLLGQLPTEQKTMLPSTDRLRY